MNPDTKIFRLEGVVQHYNWGGSVFIPALLGNKNQGNLPFAEYWLGAHNNAPSMVNMGTAKKQLNTFIAENPPNALGEDVAKRFGTLPYLLKVLDVKDMLSIQVHPAKKAAVLDYAAENKKGIPVDASHRNYKDENHKPELMLALSEFWLLHGFKPAEQLKAILQTTKALNHLLPIFSADGYAGLYKYVMELDQETINRLLQPHVDQLTERYEKGGLRKDEEDFWAARAARLFNNVSGIDRGLFSIYFFNLVHLQPGQAIFQDAGVPHAYLEGQNIEIMANSDNVLRGGLTNKHIAIQELMKHMRFEATVPQIMKGKEFRKGEEIYETPAADFQLSQIRLQGNETLALASPSIDIFFVYEGELVIKSEDLSISCKKGQALISFAGSKMVIQPAGNVTVFRASVPGL